MDRLLSWFGLARRLEVVSWKLVAQIRDEQIEELSNALKVEEWRRKVDEVTYRKAEAGHVRVIAALMDEIAERSVA